MAQPTFVAEYESTWSDTGTTRTVSVTRNSGDRLVALACTSDNGATLATPTLSGVTWTLATSRGGANNTWVYVWTGTATTSTTSDLSITRSGTTQLYGVNVFRFTASDGFGNAASGGADSGGPSQALTTTQADSTICAISSDWNAVDGTSRTARTVSGATYTERTYTRNASYATVYAGTWEGVGAAGSKTVGWSAPTGQDYSIAAIEILGTASGTPATFTTNTGNATAEGGSSTFTGAAVFTTVAGDASAEGGVSTFTAGSGVTFTTTAGDAAAGGGSSTFTGAALFATTAGDATADGGVSSFIGGSSSTFTTLTGDATAEGGVGAFTTPGTFTTLAGAATAEGGVTTFAVAVVLATLAGNATAAGGTSTFTGAAVFTTTTGDATASGGVSLFIAGEIPAALLHLGTHRESSHLGAHGTGHLGTHRETAH